MFMKLATPDVMVNLESVVAIRPGKLIGTTNFYYQHGEALTVQHSYSDVSQMILESQNKVGNLMGEIVNNMKGIE